MSTEDGTAFELDWLTGVTLLWGGLVLLFTSLPFVNRQSTVHVNLTAVFLVGTPIAIAVALWLLVQWFRPRDSRAPPHWNLKQDSPGTWAVVGIGVAMLAAITVLFSTYRVGLVSAQILPGTVSKVRATVTSYVKLTGRGRGCKARATFSVDWGSDLEACVEPVSFETLVPRRLEVGEVVTLDVRRTFAGDALTAVELTDQAPHNAGIN